MKLPLNNQRHTFRLLPCLMLALALFVSSCNREDPVEVTEEDAVDLVESTVATDDEGVAAVASDGARMAVENATACLAGDSTFTSEFTGSVRQYTFNVAWDWTVTCEQAVPQAFNLATNSLGSFSGTRLDYNGESAVSLVITNLVSGDPTVNGSATNNFTVTTKVRTAITFDARIAFTFINVAFDRTTYEIKSGTAGVTFTGSTADGNSYSYAGTLTFLGGGSATLVLGGNTYNITV
ncbi:MAG: hypothetical protein AAGN35_00565 [Bacteroidota bacterium]